MKIDLDNENLEELETIDLTSKSEDYTGRMLFFEELNLMEKKHHPRKREERSQR